MSKRHQSSRRRSYGRRQHELHERTDRFAGAVDLAGDLTTPDYEQRWNSGPAVGASAASWIQVQGID
jgi:hypothetical protein